MLPREIYTTQQVTELDRIAIQAHGISGYELMQRAGLACFTQLLKSWPETRHVCVYCGCGNNGGDGYIIARLAVQAGLQVKLIERGDTRNMPVDANQARQDWLKCATAETAIETAQKTFSPQDLDQPHNVIVDALLGTGLSRKPEGEWLQAIQQINAAKVPVIAVDIPSGLDSDTGMPLGEAVIASQTLCFIGLKQGLLTGKAGDYTGKLAFDALGLPNDVYTGTTPVATRLTHALLSQLLSVRKPSSHKGDYGHALIIGGAPGMQGAAQMAAEASARCGAGLTTMASEQAQAPRPEIMTCHIDSSHLDDNSSALNCVLNRATVIAIGPGLDAGQMATALLQQCIQSNKPLVVDAGALRLLARSPQHRDHWILTPHPGEAAQLLGTSTTEIQQDRFLAIRAIQQKYGGVCILKGFGSLVYENSRDNKNTLSICTQGNPGMASGGMGDVLTGIICGLLAQHLSLYDAARLGVYMHARAADLAAQQGGTRGLLATDLLPCIQCLVNPDTNHETHP